MYNLLDMKLMQYASEELNLSAVAARARLSLPAVSIRLSNLEKSTGVQLLHRTGQLRVTPAGKRFLESAATILKEADALSADLDLIKSGKTARLRIMCNASVAIDDLPLVIDVLEEEFPTLYVEILEGSFPDIRNAVMDGIVDIGLLSSDMHIPGLQFIKYKTEELVLVCPKDHPLAQNSIKQVSFVDTLGYDFIGVDHSKYIRALADMIAIENNLHIKYRAIVSNFETQCVLVGKTQLGIALVMETVAKRHLHTTNTTIIKLTDDWAKGDFMVCVRDLENSPPLLQRFTELMQIRYASIK
ncbi:LysR family transcriptional regulator [Undibacterium sp. SXout11W]|uniref:LysR family transcriptional regulator n=1 Tax=Undibacterium sp. SXout11W TaxID=3413050 RepID=UPI003BF30492